MSLVDAMRLNIPKVGIVCIAKGMGGKLGGFGGIGKNGGDGSDGGNGGRIKFAFILRERSKAPMLFAFWNTSVNRSGSHLTIMGVI